MIIDIDERDVKYERAGFSPTEPIIPHSVVAIDDYLNHQVYLSWQGGQDTPPNIF